MKAPAAKFAAVLAAAFTLLTTTSSASTPSVSAVVSADSVRVVEPFTVTVSVQVVQDARVTFPNLQNKLGQFEILNTQDIFDVADVNDPSLRTWTRRFTLECLETGELEIPPLDIAISQAGTTIHLTTQPIAVRVISVLEDRRDPSKFRDIQPVVDVALPEPRSTRVMPWTAVATFSLLGLALCICVAVYRHRQRVTPAVWAAKQIDGLNPANLNVADQLYQIVREYLALQFELSHTGGLGPGHSAQEIVQNLSDHRRIRTVDAERLSALFDLMDQAKFSGGHLSPSEMSKAVLDARELVTELASRAGESTLGRDAVVP